MGRRQRLRPSGRASIHFRLGCFTFPHEMSQQRTPHAAATQQAASDEQAQQPALPASAFVLVVLAFILVFVITLAALAQEMEEDRPTDAAATQYPAANQKAQDPAMIFAFVFVFTIIVVLVLVLVLVLLLTAFAQEVRKKQAADAAATQQATRNQELQDTMLLIASLLALFTQFLASFATTALTKQAREKQAPHTPTAQAAADHQFVKF